MSGDMLENIEIEDTFYNPKKKLLSHMYRLTYKSIDAKIKNSAVFVDIVNSLQQKLRDNINKRFKEVILR